MYCSKCGTQSSEGDVFCRKCGFPLNQTAPNATPSPTPQKSANVRRKIRTKQKSGLATASFILGLVLWIIAIIWLFKL